MINMTQKEIDVVKNLQAQEKMCIEKYTRGIDSAKDPELKNLFGMLKKDEQRHYDSLGQILNGTVPTVGEADKAVKNYSPVATYVGNYNEADKANDQFLCTDTITTEKYVSSAYNFNLFQFADTNVRKLLNNIETDEQNHAEKIYMYKSANQMV